MNDHVQINVSQKDTHFIQVADECRYIARMLGLNLCYRLSLLAVVMAQSLLETMTQRYKLVLSWV
jgi:hypothetical protein